MCEPDDLELDVLKLDQEINQEDNEEPHNTKPTEISQRHGNIAEENTNNSNELSDVEAEKRFLLWYEDVNRERMSMLAAEEEYKREISNLHKAEKGYKRRVAELEHYREDLVRSLETTQNEIRTLRTKYEPSTLAGNIYQESYEVISNERARLLNAEDEYKKMISHLKEEVKTLKDTLQENSNEKRKNSAFNRKKKISRLVVITSTERLDILEKENARLKYELERLVKGKISEATTHVTETKIRSLETVSVRKTVSKTIPKDTYIINKKSTPPFLPRLDSVSSMPFSDYWRSSLTPSGSRRHLLHARLMDSPKPHRSTYSNIHRERKILESSKTSETSEKYIKSLSKYLI